MKRFAPALLVAAALVVAATGVPTPASAATRPAAVTAEPVGVAAPSSHDARGILVTAPPAPSGDVGIAASPTISPSVSTSSVLPGATYTCPYGYFCAQVWAGFVWKVFFLYNCQIYDVYNWTGTGYWRNNQTSSAPNPYLLGYEGYPIRTLSKSPSSGSADWNPVYAISPCY